MLPVVPPFVPFSSGFEATEEAARANEDNKGKGKRRASSDF
jgi:hypothetical protein